MQALVIVAHGSHLNPDASAPTYTHADTVRAAGGFDEVRTAFLEEEPSVREVLRTVESHEIYVVPLFVSEGYFTEEVIPRELRLEGWTGWDSDGTSATHATLRAADVEEPVHYCGPVGTHDAMSDVIVRRAESVTAEPEVGPGVGLAVVGHGTEHNATSTNAIEYHVDRIADRDRFDEVEALFTDEAPSVADLTDHFDSTDVVLVPLFVADGYHTQENIPEDVGLTDDYRTGWETPAEVEGHRVWYAGAVGTEPLLAGALIEPAADASADGGTRWRRSAGVGEADFGQTRTATGRGSCGRNGSTTGGSVASRARISESDVSTARAATARSDPREDLDTRTGSVAIPEQGSREKRERPEPVSAEDVRDDTREEGGDEGQAAEHQVDAAGRQEGGYCEQHRDDPEDHDRDQAERRRPRGPAGRSTRAGRRAGRGQFRVDVDRFLVRGAVEDHVDVPRLAAVPGDDLQLPADDVLRPLLLVLDVDADAPRLAALHVMVGRFEPRDRGEVVVQVEVQVGRLAVVDEVDGERAVGLEPLIDLDAVEAAAVDVNAERFEHEGGVTR
jgi:sirohydrochlorin cobaltochelatase